MLPSYKLTLRINWLTQFLMIGFAIPFTSLAIMFVRLMFHDFFGNFWGFLFSAGIAYFGWGNALSTIQITDESVTVNVFYGRFRIYWDEVTGIAQRGPFIALLGADKRVVLSLAFAGRNQSKLLEFFNQQIKARQIAEISFTDNFPLKHLNARVWW